MWSRRFYQRFVFLGALAALTLIPRASAAQGDALVGRIIGQVIDETGLVLPGVTVTIASPALQVREMTDVTDGNGEYRFTQLPVGTYAVTYTLTGFQTIRLEGIRITAGFTARLDQRMPVGAVEETVTVTGESPQVDVTATATTTQVTREALEVIPTGNNGYIGLMQLTPGARPPLDVGGSTNNQNPSFRAFGQSADAWQLIDGVVTNNPRIGDSGNYFDFRSFEEATVETVGHDASVPARGIAVNTVIKSGGNQLHGSAFAGFTNNSLQSAPATETGTELKDRGDYAAEIGGAIAQDKLWYWFGFRYQRNLTDLAGTGADVPDSFCFQPDGSRCTHTSLSYFFTPKITWQVNESDKVSGFFMWNKRDDTEDLNSLRAWSTRRNQTSVWSVPTNGASKVDWTGVRGDNLVLNAMWGYFWNKSGTFFYEGETDTLIHMRDRDTGRREGSSHRAGERQGENRIQYKFSANYYIAGGGDSTHELKFGVDYFTVAGNRNVLDRGEAQNYRLDYTDNFTEASRLYVWNYPVTPNIGIRYFDLYVADSWTIKRRLTLNLGIRYANDRGFEGESSRVSGTGPGAIVYPAQDYARQDMPTFNTLAPRLRASFDLTGDGRSVIKGGWGRYRAMRQSDDIHMIANNFLGQTVYDWEDSNGNLLYDPGEVDLDVNGPDFREQTLSGVGEFDANGVINPDEVAPQSDEFLVQFEQQLVRDVAVRATGIYSKATKQYRLLNTSRPPEVFNIPITNPDPGPDGIVGNADDTGNFITYFDYADEFAGLDFQTPTLFNDPLADRDYKSFEVAMSKRMSNNWQFQGSYSATKLNEPFETEYEDANLNPNDEIFSGNQTWEWGARFSGSYHFAYDILLSGNFEHRSGNPWARTAIFEGGENVDELETNVEPVGSERLPHINLLDVRFQKAFALSGSQRVEFRVNFYNILNQTPATSITTLSGPSFGTVTATLLPRIISFEAKYSF